MKNQLSAIVLSGITKYNDVVLALVIVAIIFMMILPLPTELVDGLIAINMSIGVILLMISAYIRSPLAFSVFPTVLLITTLFRLALSITTTRLILLQADAGDIIFAFGNFVVAGNLVVGAVIFLIITIVQFMVITKGSERVAEVSARFSLDAMPGKQMSIDGDMRAGVIDMEEAHRRREMVEKESQLYGAMDGAMKFVKGDAIAGLIIIVVNMLGGISIGVMQQDMLLENAMETYSILTIGDGLISQIPALLISITAGIIVTRVTTEKSVNLGSDIGLQIFAQPKAILIASGVMFVFALIPGFPSIIFIILGMVFLLVGYTLIKQSSAEVEGKVEPGIPAMAKAGETPSQSNKRHLNDGKDFSLTLPLLIDVDTAIKESIDTNILNDELLKIRQALYLDLGVPFPGIHLRFNMNLSHQQYTILIHEIPMVHGQFKKNHLFCREKTDSLQMFNIPYITEDPFLPALDTVWVDKKYQTTLDKAALPYMDISQILTYHLSFVLKKYADEFIGIQETRYLLEEMEAEFPELVKEVQRVLPIQKITDVFQRLVSEEISIRNLRSVLESLLEWGQKEKDTVLLSEYVRRGLSRYISYKYSNGQNILPAYLLNPDVEETIRNGIRQTSGGSYLALEPDVTRHFVEQVKSTVGNLHQSQSRPVMITSMDIRRYVRKLLELDVRDLPVLSYQELTPEITIQPLSRIDL